MTNILYSERWVVQTAKILGVDDIRLNYYPTIYLISTKENKMKYQLEIRAGEGGDDAKLFVNDLMSAYIRMFDQQD